ncbi:MAG: hypothetical protein QOH72_5539 [Solirubrobacteraceae bacterium]|nr:hypothetical protein [Solirubrobacteraceae bacterium]
MNEHAAPSVSPLRVEGELDDHIGRWRRLVNRVVVISNVIVLAFLWIAFAAPTVVAFFAILITGRSPRANFDLNGRRPRGMDVRRRPDRPAGPDRGRRPGVHRAATRGASSTS